MNRPDRDYSAPILLDGPEKSSSRTLRAVPFSEHGVSEDLIQELLAEHPHLLPAEEIEAAFSPLVCLGREVPTACGPLDLLYASPGGHLTLVETKLWRNPEARRKVVGQLLDYAKEISRWSFEELEQAVLRARECFAEDGIFAAVEAAGYDVDERLFFDNLARDLKRGRFLLLIAGDGIREDVEAITQFLEKGAHLRFTMALVELSFFWLKDRGGPLLVQPRIVARTREIVRAVVEVHAPRNIDVDVRLPEQEGPHEPSTRTRITEETFLETLERVKGSETKAQISELFDDLTSRGALLRWRSASVSIRYPDPQDTGKEFTLLVVRPDGEFQLGWLNRVGEAGYEPTAAEGYLHEVADLADAEIRNDSTVLAPVATILDKKAQFLTAVDRFLEVLNRQAEQQQS